MRGEKLAKKDEISKAILEGMASGESTSAMCRKLGISVSYFFQWVNEDPILAEQYARAREIRADVYFEEMDQIGEDAVLAENAIQVAGLRLKADNLKWKLARMSPKKYGDRVQNELTGANGGPITSLVKVQFE